MSDVTQIMREFVEAYWRDAAADPRDFLERVEGDDRAELLLLIDGFLAEAPRQAWDPKAFEGSMAERAVAAAESPAVSWPKLLRELRERAQLSRATVVRRLAAALGFPGEQSRVAAYYHRMEIGDLPEAGVSTRVLEKLGGIVGIGAEQLREAGRAGEAGLGSGGEVFARLGAPTPRASTSDEQTRVESADSIKEPDELDLLFTGGD